MESLLDAVAGFILLAVCHGDRSWEEPVCRIRIASDEAGWIRCLESIYAAQVWSDMADDTEKAQVALAS